MCAFVLEIPIKRTILYPLSCRVRPKYGEVKSIFLFVWVLHACCVSWRYVITIQHSSGHHRKKAKKILKIRSKQEPSPRHQTHLLFIRRILVALNGKSDTINRNRSSASSGRWLGGKENENKWIWLFVLCFKKIHRFGNVFPDATANIVWIKVSWHLPQKALNFSTVNPATTKKKRQTNTKPSRTRSVMMNVCCSMFVCVSRFIITLVSSSPSRQVKKTKGKHPLHNCSSPLHSHFRPKNWQ